jgi:hypothetical protein
LPFQLEGERGKETEKERPNTTIRGRNKEEREEERCG